MFRKILSASFEWADIPVIIGTLAFCVWNFSLPKEATCLSGGCEVFGDFRPFGIDLWLAGIGVTGILLGVFLAARLAPRMRVTPKNIVRANDFADFFAIIVLFSDAIFLAFMLFGSPCLNCLLFGFFLFVTVILRLSRKGRPGRKKIFRAGKVALNLWIWLAMMNMGACVWATGDYVMANPSASASLWFSPSCAHCLGALRDHPNARLLPVAESADDIRVIARMQECLDNGYGPARALAAARLAARPLSAPESLRWEIRLWKNRARVIGMGGVLPTLVERGVAPARVDPGKAFDALPWPGNGDLTLSGTELNAGR